MRTKALLTSILLGSLSLAGVASADPIIRDHRTPQPTITIRPAYYQQPVQQTYGYQVSGNGQYVQPYTYGHDPRIEYTPRSSWVTLADNVQLNQSTDRRILDLNGTRAKALELQSERGRIDVTQVLVEMSDGRNVLIKPQRELDRSAPNLRIDLGSSANCGINRVVVYGQGAGQFRLIGA